MTGKMPHIVQYQGSKRALAPRILAFMPERFGGLVEPFAGTAAVSIAAAHGRRTDRFRVNDINGPLMEMLRCAVENPRELIAGYERLWNEQFDFGENHMRHFNVVRERFNGGEKTPENMLYLLARCVKGSVRYDRDGNFNQSPDRRRHGTRPDTLADNVLAVSALLKGKAAFTSLDYREILETAKREEIVYMDPPYRGVCDSRDSRYLSGIDPDEFAGALETLDRRGIRYIVSYDGTSGGKRYGEDLPSGLRCRKFMLAAGLSGQGTLLGRRAATYEALYVSEELMGDGRFPADGL